MAAEDNVLAALKSIGALDEEEQKVAGIAQLAIDKGFNTLSALQQKVLEPLLTKGCAGVEDPGGYHNECTCVLTGEDLATAVEQSGYFGEILCENCRDESERYAREWERIQAE